MVQIVCRISSLLEYTAEVQPYAKIAIKLYRIRPATDKILHLQEAAYTPLKNQRSYKSGYCLNLS